MAMVLVLQVAVVHWPRARLGLILCEILSIECAHARWEPI